MAAFHHSRAGSRAQHGGNSVDDGQELPSGCCNFRDLRPGASLTSCGCKRFWLNVDHYTGVAGAEREFCFCGHHACFHDAFSQQKQQEAGVGTQPASGAGRSRQAGAEGHRAPTQGYVAAQATLQTSPKRATGLGIRPDSSSQSHSINTRIWDALNGFARQQEEGDFSNVPSTAAPSIVDESRFSPGQQTQQHAQRPQHMGPPVNIPPNMGMRPNGDELSATEVNTPSLAGTPDFRVMASSSNQTGPSPGHLAPQLFIAGQRQREFEAERPQATPLASGNPGQPTIERSGRSASVEPSLLELQNLVRAYGHRLDLLESLSFSHVPVEEVQERFELFDGRLLDLEQWRSDRDHEAQQISPEPAKASSDKRRRMEPLETQSFSSDRSFDSGAAAHTEAVVMATLATSAITDPRIEALEHRVADLESASVPSFARLWQVQVVLLPWGRQLRGIWFSSMEATQRSLRSTQDEWSGAQSMPKLSFKSTDSAAWTTESIQAWANEAQDWLSPKACGPNGTVFQRLASRGLVQDVTFSSPDSRHFSNTLRTAFGGFLRKSETGTDSAGTHQALAEEYIPLRKVRKSSRLRFLTPSEMVTSATWDAAFLDASVFMKVGDGQRRLYLTTPDAYLQSSEEGWTWPMLRQLPVFDASAAEQSAQGSGTAIEACWSYNEHLDHAVNVHSSFASRASQWSAESPVPPDTREDDAHEAPSASSYSAGQLRHTRTVSLPTSSLAASGVREDLPKRRIASFETGGMVPVLANDHGLEVQAKRRRISLSPEAERRGVNFTPRRSGEPPSPFTSEGALEARSQGASSRNRRGTTPFAYATPHSNSQYVGRPQYLGGDGDTEADTDIAAEHSIGAEEEWEGVDDEQTTSPAAGNEQELGGDDEVDDVHVEEENLD